MRRKLFTIFGLAFASFVFVLTMSVGKSTIRPIDPSVISGEFDGFDILGNYLGQQFESKKTSDIQPKVLGTNNTEKRIEVDLTNQKVYAYENDIKIYEFLISSGKWGKTPTGTFRIWGKFRYTKMEGGSKILNTYYYLPNVPYVMFFENDKIPAYRGFSLHGTYWHSNFGTPMSHGCINMRIEDAGILYNWANPYLGDKKSGRATDENPGTEVIIYGIAPKS